MIASILSRLNLNMECLASGLDILGDAGVDISGGIILTGGGAAVQAAAIFHGCSITEIRDQWAPDLEIGANQRADQAVTEMRHGMQTL